MIAGIGAGFEVARLGERCLAAETRHVPESRMLAHYRVASDHAISWARDGLPPDCIIRSRMACAYARPGRTVVFDLCHYWHIPDPAAHATKVARAHKTLRGDAPLWVCPINEVGFHPVMRPGEDEAYLVATARTMLHVLRQECADVRVLTAEPAHSVGELHHHALADEADVIGLNMHACHQREAPHHILVEAARRWHKPIVISETSLHVGHPNRWLHIDNKASWLRYMLREIETARALGANVLGLCWHPFINSPSWHGIEHGHWDHGLIREDGSLDHDLSNAMREAI